MKECLFAATLFFLGIVGTGVDALAGWILTDRDGSKTYVSEGKVKEVPQEAGEPSLIMDYKKEQVLFINLDEKVCAQASFDEYCRVVSKMVSAMQSAAKARGEETDTEPPPEVSIERVGKGGKIAGFDTAKYEVYADGERYEEIWLTTDASLVSQLGSLDALRKLAFCLNKGMAGEIESSPEYVKLITSGVVLKAVSYEMGNPEVDTEIVRIEKKEFPPGEFALPAGCRDVGIRKALGMESE
jgi:hypothetical protein